MSHHNNISIVVRKDNGDATEQNTVFEYTSNT